MEVPKHSKPDPEPVKEISSPFPYFKSTKVSAKHKQTSLHDIPVDETQATKPLADLPAPEL